MNILKRRATAYQSDLIAQSKLIRRLNEKEHESILPNHKDSFVEIRSEACG